MFAIGSVVAKAGNPSGSDNFLAFGGVWEIIGGIGHISGQSGEVAKSIGYRPSMFQWEVGWADIGLGVPGLGCIWKRDAWMTAAVVMLAISFGGDAIGHIIQWAKHSNTEPDNVWAIPSDLVGPLLAVLLLIRYRRTSNGRDTLRPAQSVA